jgi:hypothetical protein
VVGTKQVAWSKPQPVGTRGAGQWLAEYALILAVVTATLGSATISVNYQVSVAFASVATALHP